LKPVIAGRAGARLVLALIAAAALAACAGGAGSGSRAGASQELKTASDHTMAEKRANIRLQLAVGYFKDGKYDIALDEVKQAIAADPDSAEAYGVRALIYAQMGEFTLADENFQRAIKLAPRNPELSNNYGSFLCQQGRAAQGIALFDAALANPTYTSPMNALLNAGACSLKAKNYEAAERYLMEAMRLNPDLPTINANLARVYYERRDMTRAGFFINRLKTVTKLDALTADQLWLTIRIDRKLGDKSAEASLVSQLRRRFGNSPELAAYQRGAFDE
jgi:type IV pilus assembly protein PilF